MKLRAATKPAMLPPTFANLYGSAPSGAGALAPFLGDPSRYKRPFNDNGGRWAGVVDDAGNHWWLLVAHADGAELYDWTAMSNGDDGSANAKALYEAAEASNGTAARLTIDKSRSFGWSDLSRKQLHVYVGTEPRWVQDPPQNPSAPLAVQQAQAGATGHYENTFDAGVATPENGNEVSRVTGLVIKFPTKTGKAFELYATGNTWLRIAYVTGIVGVMHTGGSALTSFVLEALPELLETLKDIVLIVVAYYTGNVMLLVSAAVDIAKTWWSYSEQLAAQAAAANAKGQALAQLGQGAAPSAVFALAAQLRKPTVGATRSATRSSSSSSAVLLVGALLVVVLIARRP